MENKISKESAEISFESFLDYYDIDKEDLTDEEKLPFEQGKRRIIKAIRTGRLEITIDDKLVITQNVKGGQTIEYQEVTGKAKMEMDKEKGNYGKVYALLGSLSGLGGGAFKKLSGKDLSLAETLGAVFLLV